MKWFKRTAQGFNPGSSGYRTCPESGTRGWVRLADSQRGYQEITSRSPLFLLRPYRPTNYGGQGGRILYQRYPGLKPSAVLSDHFMVKDRP